MNILIDGQVLFTEELNRGIGVYFRNTVNNLLKVSLSHRWYIALPGEDRLGALDPWVRERLIPVVDEAFAPSADYSTGEAYTCRLEQVIREKSIDVYWNPDPMMMNVLFPSRRLDCRTVLTMFDLIPAALPVYDWPHRLKEEYDRRLRLISSWDNICLICISDATRSDVWKYIGKDMETSVTFLGVDSLRFYSETGSRTDGSAPRIVFTGGFDKRKNIYGALEAFAEAKRNSAPGHPVKRAEMSVVCNADEKSRREFYDAANRLGIGDSVRLTGFVTDSELRKLYSECDVFFFPSLYEGFGLPILEAMLAGAYVLSADNSSLPEVCGEYAMLCDAGDVGDMSRKLAAAVEESLRESADEKKARQAYALGFTWKRTAEKTLEAIEKKEKKRTEKKKIAIVGPWPEQRTGIATYTYRLLPFLSGYFDIDFFTDSTADTRMLPNRYGGLYPISELDDRHSDYYKIIYEIGNNSRYHKKVYEYLLKYPGIAEIHDYVLNPFFYHAFYLAKDKETYKNALISGYGEKGLEHYKAIDKKLVDPDEIRFPMAHSVSSASSSTIVHNMWSADNLGGRVSVIPLACFNDDTDGTNRSGITDRYHLEDDELVISCFGYVNWNKRPEIILEAVSRLIEDGCKARLIFWGQSNTPDFEEKIKSRYPGKVTVTGFISEEVYNAGFARSDIVVNLRYPSMGEASGTLCDAFRYGKPVIVSAVNQYMEFPDDVCWKVEPGPHEADCLYEMLSYLAGHEEVRKALGRNALDYAAEVLSPEKTALQYYNAIMSD